MIYYLLFELIMKEDSKNSKKQKSSKNSKKIIINTKEDLNKLSFSALKNTKIFDFGGDYFNFIYERALGIEKNPVEKESLLSSNNFSSNKTNSKKAPPLKESKTSKTTFKTVKKSAKKPTNNNPSNTKKKEEDKNINNNINLNNNYFKQNDYNIYNSNDNYDDYANQSLPLPKIKYNQDMHLVKKELKVDYIVFQMRYNTRPGEDLGVIGSINELGMWDQNKALKLVWNEGNIWKTKINYNFTQNSMFEFKFIFISNGKVKQWEDGNNRKLIYQELKDIIEPSIKEGCLVEFKNINGNNIIYNYKENTLTVVCDWNKK